MTLCPGRGYNSHEGWLRLKHEFVRLAAGGARKVRRLTVAGKDGNFMPVIA